MYYADFMGFPFPHHKVMAKDDNLLVDGSAVLDACHTTSVPPYIGDMASIVREHTWFVRQIGRQAKPTRTAYFFGLQHPPHNATVTDLLLLKGLGVRFMTLAYEGANEYGGGFAVPDEPLSTRGRELIRAMAETGFVLDLSHAGHRTARDAICYLKEGSIKVRVAATHTACFDLYDHGRGLPDDVLLDVCGLGGLIGLVTITWMLDAKSNGIEPFLHHLDHLIGLVGPKNVCLGTDGVYHHLDPEEAKERFRIMKERIDPRGVFHARHPEQAAQLNCPERLMVIEALLGSSGLPRDHSENIVGGNLFQFLSRL